jgi:hypothetical protein
MTKNGWRFDFRRFYFPSLEKGKERQKLVFLVTPKKESILFYIIKPKGCYLNKVTRSQY